MNIYQLIKQQETNLLNGKPIKIGKYAYHDHLEKISTIQAYLNSQHISSKRDALDREKPFFNIGLFAAYTWYKSTDISRKNIKFRAPNRSKRLKSLIATLKLREWMNKEHFGQFLNQWGWTLACYGSAITKFVEKGGSLIPSIISWDRMICDPVDFKNNPKIEKLYFTPAQLRQQPYDQEQIEEVIKTQKEVRETIENEEIDIANEYIGIYELHGNLPLSYLTGKEKDEQTYTQQMHVCFIAKNKQGDDIESTLYSGKEEKDPYYISHLIEQEGRTLSIGAIESIFEAQWMVNDSVKKIKDQLDLSTKIALQTDDENFVGRNYLQDWTEGTIAVMQDGKTIQPINTQSRDIPQVMQFLESWKIIAKEITGAHDSITGKTMPSGTPYRLGMILNQEAMGMFNMMLENKGLHLEEMLREYILPYFKKTLKTTDELEVVLKGEELEEFDELTLPARLEKQLRASLEVGIPSVDKLMEMVETEGIRRTIKPSDNKDKTWSDYFKDFEFDPDIEITGENRDKNAVITTLSSLFQTMSQDPQAFSPEERRRVVNKIIDEVGSDIISPLELKGISQMAGMPQETPTGETGGMVGMPELTLTQ